MEVYNLKVFANWSLLLTLFQGLCKYILFVLYRNLLKIVGARMKYFGHHVIDLKKCGIL